MTRTFPFVPKSSTGLEVGDFWSIPLANGRFACGRVLGSWFANSPGGQRGFFAGLLDWSSVSKPTSTAIAGARTLVQGGAHIKTIVLTGGAILGNRPLQEDGITIELFADHRENRYPYVFRGLEQIRVASQKELDELPRIPMFGFKFMQEYANEHLR